MRSEERPDSPVVTIPRVSRLMALAIKLDRLVRGGEIRDFHQIAHLGHVSRPRVTQIINFMLLAPDIQEEILFLPRTIRGTDPILEKGVRPIMSRIYWNEQRALWREVLSEKGMSTPTPDG